MCMNTSVCALCTVCIQVAHRRASLKSVPVCISWSCLRVHTPLPLRLVCVCFLPEQIKAPRPGHTDRSTLSWALHGHTALDSHIWSSNTAAGRGRKEGRKEGHNHHTSSPHLPANTWGQGCNRAQKWPKPQFVWLSSIWALMTFICQRTHNLILLT